MTTTLISPSTGPERSEPGSVNIPKAVYPSNPPLPPSSTQVDEIASDLVRRLNDAIYTNKSQDLAGLFLKDAYWRDHLASSWDLRTIKGASNIASFCQEHQTLKQVAINSGSEFQAPHYGPLDGVGDPQGITFLVDFSSSLGTGRGVIRLACEDGQWKIWTIGLTLEKLSTRDEPLGPKRPQGVEHGGFTDRKNWLSRRVQEQEFREHEPAVLVIGRLRVSLAELHCTDYRGRSRSSWTNSIVSPTHAWHRHASHRHQCSSGRQLAKKI